MNLLTKTDLENLLRSIINMEDRLKDGAVTWQEYASIVRLCQAVEAPQFVTEHFAHKYVRGEFNDLENRLEGVTSNE